MSKSKKVSTEYSNKNSDNNSESYNRRNVDNIKHIILMVFLIACAIPILFCLYLMVKMNSMERKLDEISMKLGSSMQKTEGISDMSENAEDILQLEQAAYENLEINTESKNTPLSLTDVSDDMDEPMTSEAVVGSNSKTQANGKKVYLTFDDGPSIYTGEILDILEANDVKATFFVVHNDDEGVWKYYKQIVDEGHTLGMHSYSHEYDKIYASQEAFEEDVTKIHDFLYEQAGVDCTVYRFPGGSSNSVSNVDIQDLMEYLYSRGITYYDWNSLSGDAVDMSLSPKELNANIMEYVRSNQGDSIVLMHDLKNNHATVEGLQNLIDTLKSEGYEICPIDDTTIPVQHVTYISEE